jgi:peptide-methionine (S)-S-oxide reductase
MEVVTGDTGHIEATKIDYNSDIIDSKQLLKTLFLNIDPFDSGGQFCDRGYSYRSAIFSNDKGLIDQAKELIKKIEKNHNQKVQLMMLPFKNFYIAEDYHQDYYKKNPIRYNYYKYSCGREKKLNQIKINLK